MATLTVYANTSDGHILCTGNTYTKSKEGTGTKTVVATGASAIFGQGYDGSNYSTWEYFLLFDTSGLPDNAIVTAALLEICFQSGPTPVAFTAEARTRSTAWGPTLDTADFVTGSTLGSHALRASLASSAFTSGDTYAAFTSDPSFAGAISLTGTTELFITSSRSRGANTPANGQTESAGIDTAENGTTYAPRLTITYSLPAPGADLAGAIVASSTVSASGMVTMGPSAALAGAIGASSTVTGALTTSALFTGSTAGAATVTGALTNAPGFAGAIAASSTVTGALTKPAAVLAGSLAAFATVTGFLSAPGSGIGGAVFGECTVTGALTITPRFTGATAGVATVTGTLRGSALFAGAIVASSWVTASGLISGALLTGYAAGSATLTGALVSVVTPGVLVDLRLDLGPVGGDLVLAPVGPIDVSMSGVGTFDVALGMAASVVDVQLAWG